MEFSKEANINGTPVGKNVSNVSEIDSLTARFTSSVVIDKKRTSSDNNWEEKASPIQKKLDIDETPCFDRSKADERREDEAYMVMSPPLKSPPTPIAKETPMPPPPPTPLKEATRCLVVGAVCAEHNTGEHQENAQRTNLLCGEGGCLSRSPLKDIIDFINADDLPNPPLVDLLRVHEYAYLQHLEEKVRAHAKGGGRRLPAFYAPAGYLDTDTPLAPQSLNAAKKFCSAAMLAVDKVMQPGTGRAGDGAYERAFVIGRPPGHHAGPNGCVPSRFFWRNPSMTTSGFCLLNTVAVAAAYARYRYGRDDPQRAPRIAIVDIDIHHGNGTEEIVRNLTPHLTPLPLPSSWAPVHLPSYKPWLLGDEEEDGSSGQGSDREAVFFCSIHRYEGENFYPGGGEGGVAGGASEASTGMGLLGGNGAALSSIGSRVEGGLDECNDRILNIPLTPIPPKISEGAVGYGSATHKRGKTKKLEDLIAEASKEFRSKVSALLIPKLQSFRPDLVFISAGFDAHYDDAYYYLSEDDIHWVTSELGRVCDEAGGKGVISVLEGGYSLHSDTDTPGSAGASAVATSGEGGAMNLRNKSKSNDGKTGAVIKKESSLPPSRFAIRPGDGGLVKGVLAHMAALTRREGW